MTGCRQQEPRIGLTKCPDLVDHDKVMAYVSAINKLNALDYLPESPECTVTQGLGSHDLLADLGNKAGICFSPEAVAHRILRLTGLGTPGKQPTLRWFLFAEHWLR